MSCIITFKGKKYSEEQFKEYFINNKQEFATSIAKNKDVIDSFKRKMEGIDYVFSQSPELASIGNKAQYLQYLSTIFKTSKVKDIVYHGTTDENFFVYDSKEGEYVFKLDKLNQNTHFGTLQAAKDRIQIKRNNADSIKVEMAKDLIIPVIINIIPKAITDQADSNTAWRKEIELAKQENFTGLSYSNIKEDKGSTSYLVFEPEQIHILSSESDIKGFKEFVNKKDVIMTVSLDEIMNNEEQLKEMYNNSSKRFTFEKYKSEVKKYILYARTTVKDEEIVDKIINCF